MNDVLHSRESLQETKVIVLIPTQGRPNELSRALESVRNQTRQPDGMVIVHECETDLGGSDRTDWAWPAVFAANLRTHNLSGAVNQGIDEILIRRLEWGLNPDSTYLALLDDDDWWDERYLEHCVATVTTSDTDLAVAGIQRYDVDHPEGRKLSIPKSLEIDDFLVGNPNLQGSNLFVRLSCFLRTGGFDEQLQSTTDRDFCIRLFESCEVRWSRIDTHLVHHNARSEGRLSDRGGTRKEAGLRAFADKHLIRMSADQRSQFRERSKRLFEIDPLRVNENVHIEVPHSLPVCDGPDIEYELTIAATITDKDRAESFLDEVDDFMQGFLRPWRLVVVLFRCREEEFSALLDVHSDLSERTQVHLIHAFEKIADIGRLGPWFLEPARRRGIAWGRTVLHRAVLDAVIRDRRPVTWILDDDMRLSGLHVGIPTKKADWMDFDRFILSLFERNIAIGVGTVIGDPPLPAINSTRVQLLDLNQSLMATSTDFRHTPSSTPSEQSEWYYDLSTKHTNHLEWPLVHSLGPSPVLRAADVLRGLRKGVVSFRQPIVSHLSHPWFDGDTLVTRGGNTLILDMECLRLYPNISPIIKGEALRRSDTLWALWNQRLGGRVVAHKTKKVCYVPLHLPQDRRASVEEIDPLHDVKEDILGSGFTRALDEHLLSVRGSSNLRTSLMNDDVGRLAEDTRTFAERRWACLVQNLYRSLGLLNVLKSTSFTPIDCTDEEVRALEQETALFRERLEPAAERAWSMDIGDNVSKGLETFLRDLPNMIDGFREKQPVPVGEVIEAEARLAITKIAGKNDRALIGHGWEGVVLADAERCWKRFHHGSRSLSPELCGWLKELCSRENVKHLPNIHAWFTEGDELILEMERVEGEPYDGGGINALRSLLKEAMKERYVITNVHPDNIIMKKGGRLVHVDIGRSIRPFDPDLFEDMCRRTYLSWRWWFRPDLRELMTRMTTGEVLPELFGYEWFRASLEVRSKREIHDPWVLDLLGDLEPGHALDYGCGKGYLAQMLNEQGWSVDCWDPNAEKFVLRDSPNNIAWLGNHSNFPNERAHPGGYDLVLCTLVLCVIEEEADFNEAIANISALLRPGGQVLVSVCSPFSVQTARSDQMIRHPINKKPEEGGIYDKTVLSTGRKRKDVYRSLARYHEAFNLHGLRLINFNESQGVDADAVCPSPDWMTFVLERARVGRRRDVTLLIRASAMDWRTIDIQVRHIVSQFGGPSRFAEVVIATDRHTGPFARQHTKPDLEALDKRLGALQEEGIIHRVCTAPVEDPSAIRQLNLRWFGHDNSTARAINGQPVFTSLWGLEQCDTRYVLYTDVDILYGKLDADSDIVDNLVDSLRADKKAVATCPPILRGDDGEFSHEGTHGPWRVEVRCGMLDLERLHGILPIPNDVSDNLWVLPWHRSLDRMVKEGDAHSLRPSGGSVWFAHLHNDWKEDIHALYNVMKAIERGTHWTNQVGEVNLQGTWVDWNGQRKEEIIILMRGRDIPHPRLLRALYSLQMQDNQDFGIVYFDAASELDQVIYLERTLPSLFGRRASMVMNYKALTPMENIWRAVRELCTNPDSTIVMLDTDDAFLHPGVICRIREARERGVDLTVGGMLRTDKWKDYPVCFDKPRSHRGGNVWQHLRTFRKALFDRLEEEDMMVDGEWIPHTEDWAYMVPMAEMARHPVHLVEPLYLYDPSADKSKRSIEERERLIASVMSKPSRQEVKA